MLPPLKSFGNRVWSHNMISGIGHEESSCFCFCVCLFFASPEARCHVNKPTVLLTRGHVRRECWRREGSAQPAPGCSSCPSGGARHVSDTIWEPPAPVEPSGQDYVELRRAVYTEPCSNRRTISREMLVVAFRCSVWGIFCHVAIAH